MEILAELPPESLLDIEGPDGNKISKLEYHLILGKISLYKKAQQELSRTSETRTKTRLENEKLQKELQQLRQEKDNLVADRRSVTKIIEENNEYKAKKAVSKKRIEDFCSTTRDITTIALKDVQKMVRELNSLGSNLDICFCMDATGSMSGLINGVKNCIISVSQRISSSTGMNSRFGLVVYRDYCDGALRHQIWDFTNSTNLSGYLGSVTATGGGDGPEDCFGGLYAACTKINWKAPARVIIWMGDAPQHGLKYSGGGDTYPSGDPDGITSQKIFEQLRENKIILVFCKLTSYTDLMMTQLRQEVAPFGDNLLLEYNFEGDNISEFLVKTITTTTSRTLSFFSKSGKEKSYSLTPTTWNVNSGFWRSEESCEIIKFKAYTGSTLDPLIDLLLDGPDAQKRVARIRVTIQPVARGEMRLAYYAVITEQSGYFFTRNTKTKGVVKESRYEGEINRRKYLVNQAKIQTVAHYMADMFNKKLKVFDITSKKFIYVSVELLHFPERTTGNHFYLLEPFIEGVYQKFNNNSGYVDTELAVQHPLLQTFSHFTYSFSKGLIMVTDVQGVVETTKAYKLTDPAIHTADPKHQLPDPTNLGAKGFAAFFGTHKCNEYCRRMDLKTPDSLDITTPLDTPRDTVMSSIEEADEWLELENN
jgi:hypothetical protein